MEKLSKFLIANIISFYCIAYFNKKIALPKLPYRKGSPTEFTLIEDCLPVIFDETFKTSFRHMH